MSDKPRGACSARFSYCAEHQRWTPHLEFRRRQQDGSFFLWTWCQDCLLGEWGKVPGETDRQARRLIHRARSIVDQYVPDEGLNYKTRAAIAEWDREAFRWLARDD